MICINVLKQLQPNFNISAHPDLVEFRKRFDKQFPEYGRPVIIRGALNKWSAMNSWKFDQLVARFKNQMFKVRTRCKKLLQICWK